MFTAVTGILPAMITITTNPLMETACYTMIIMEARTPIIRE